ncbi:hypothetical protein ACS0TY_026736 [Phlomoides rotata]
MHELVSQILDKVAEDYRSPIRDGNFCTVFVSVPFSRSLCNQRLYPPHSRAAPSPQTGQFYWGFSISDIDQVEFPKEQPKFQAPFLGFTRTAEIWNSRACMIGLIGTFIVELVSKLSEIALRDNKVPESSKMNGSLKTECTESGDLKDLEDVEDCLKRGGQLIYAGPLGPKSSKLIEYFEAIEGLLRIRPGYNPSTWMLDVTSSAEEIRMGIDKCTYSFRT